MKKIGLIFLCCLVCGVLASALPAPLADYAAKISQVKTLTSNFTEEKHMALLTDPLQSQGIFYFDKQAQQLRWQYQKPFNNGFLMEQNRVYRLQNGKKELIKNAMGRTLAAQMLVWLTLDFEALEKEYTVEVNKNVLTFTPRAQAHKVVKQITVWLDEKNPQLVTQVKMEEPGGDFVLWKFQHTQINPALPEGAFL